MNTLIEPTTAIDYNYVNIIGQDTITNGDFSIPFVGETDNEITYNTALLNFGGITGWTTTTPQILFLLNGEASYFPTPTMINTEQYIRINNQANIQ